MATDDGRSSGQRSGDWNAVSYDKVADPQARWGAEVLERLPLIGDETVLDAGCGTGRVTELLLARLPGGRVVALDASGAMLEQARGRLARIRRPGHVRPGGPRGAAAARRAGRRGAVHGDLPLGAGPRQALRESRFRAPSRWLARRPVRRLRERRDGSSRSPGRVHPDFASHTTSRRPRRPGRGSSALGFDAIETWLSEAPTPFDARRAVRGLPRDRLPADLPRRAPAESARPFRQGRRGPNAGADPRLRPAEHHRPPRGLERGRRAG